MLKKAWHFLKSPQNFSNSGSIYYVNLVMPLGYFFLQLLLGIFIICLVNFTFFYLVYRASSIAVNWVKVRRIGGEVQKKQGVGLTTLPSGPDRPLWYVNCNPGSLHKFTPASQWNTNRGCCCCCCYFKKLKKNAFKPCCLPCLITSWTPWWSWYWR